VTDSWLAVHPSSPPWPYTFPLESPYLSASDRIQTLGVTSNSNLNTWRAKRNDAEGIRLDYVFVNQDRATVNESAVVFTEPVTSHRCSYSDHFGINVKLQLLSQAKDDGETNVADEPVLTSDMFDTIEAVTARYIVRELRFSRRRIIHFFASLLAFVALLIGQWWVEVDYGHFLITFGAVLMMVAGVISGIISFMFGRWEISALREFLSDVQLARKVYLGESRGM
jgi:sphingomyelin phosphodiesterase 2